MRFLAPALLLLVAACGTETVSPAPPGSPPRYTGTGTVLENAEHGPQFCTVVLESLPPGCSGADVVGWDWNAVAHESRNAVKWGEYTVVGTWDGTRLTLTEPPGEPRERVPDEPDPFASPCPVPDGGWRPVDPAKATERTLAAAMDVARRSPLFAGTWVDQSHLGDGPVTETEGNDPKRLVLNLRFTGDLQENERRVREVWGGALCVSPAAHTESELNAVQSRVHRDFPAAQGSGVDTVGNRVSVQFYVVTDDLRRELDAKYGPGVVHASGVLLPVTD
ncbi:hypothetical protein EDD29_1987 [Actinocorallia herbida]|uniref:Uncharacterized protein n=1 Tax=Actinocorallia herbida TaxID=58109 RepID=A0A3N1CT17_9ACTN|nr:hypothetical protein [Actinocorallia herbida]ROO84462.1 hypothetical protein EDD29_1987 [Actinocorallia herbida]